MEKLKQSVKSFSKKPVMDKTLFHRIESVRRWAGGILFVATVFLTSVAGFITLSPVYLLGFALRCQCAQWIYDTLLCTWFAFVVALYEIVYGVKIVVQGDVTKMNKNRCSLIVMNHRTRLDWLFYFAVQARYGSLRRFKISLKNEIRHVPGAGWAMQAAQFLFLRRKWIIDRERTKTCFKNFKNARYRPQLLFFPEGTDFRPFSRQRSREYADKNELDDYEYVLHPRTLGFTSVVGYMRHYNNLDQVLDVTVSYPENILQQETDLISGNIPKVIVFTVQSFDISDVPVSNDAILARWIEDRWQKKEEFLREFYKYKDYSNNNGYSQEENLEIERDTLLYLIGSLVFWGVLVLITITGLVVCATFRWALIWSLPVCVLLSTVVGFDLLFSKMAVC